MNVQKFTYRSPHLVMPLTKCIEHLKTESHKMSNELDKYKQAHSENPYDFSDIDRNRVQNLTLKHKNVTNQIKRYEIWLNECKNRSWFTKYVLDENDLSELYQYKFKDSNL